MVLVCVVEVFVVRGFVFGVFDSCDDGLWKKVFFVDVVCVDLCCDGVEYVVCIVWLWFMYCGDVRGVVFCVVLCSVMGFEYGCLMGFLFLGGLIEG